MSPQGKPRIDFVSPLPPVRSGIADYSLDLLPDLEPLCDLRVIRLDGQPLAEAVVERWRPIAADRCGEEGRLPLYQMGNNRHHEGVLRLALERPGVLTLHDVVLHHLLIETTLGKAEFERYRDQLVADHGWVGDRVARARRWGELGDAALFELTAHRTLVRRQRGVLVHSRWAAERVREESPEVAVRVVPMGMPLAESPPAGAATNFRERFGLPADSPVLGTFGFQTPIKRTEVAIRALARPELAAAHLVIAGEVSSVLDLDSLARELGVAERVHVTGFLDFGEFITAISACDACINLRYPTAGETSASLLRVLAVGKPVAVSEYAQFSELPDEVAIKVPLGDDEVEALAAGLGRLIAEPESVRRMSAAAREMVRTRHAPALAAAAILDACGELAEREPAGDAPLNDAPPPSTLTWLDLAGRLQIDGGEAPWAEGERRRLSLRLTNDGFGSWLATRHDPGGVLVELQWRASPRDEPMRREWADLPHDLGPGDTYRCEIETRRPAGAGSLVVEPHVIGVSGFSALGGPRWTRDL